MVTQESGHGSLRARMSSVIALIINLIGHDSDVRRRPQTAPVA